MRQVKKKGRKDKKTAPNPRSEVIKRRVEKLCDELNKRNIEGIFVESSSDACRKIKKMIPKGATVALGGSVTIVESGIIDTLRQMDINLLDRYREDISKKEVDKMRREGLMADVFVSSTNAITMKGELINADGIGNRIASMIYGPQKVIIVCGINKIVKNIQEGVERIYLTAGPMNSLRFNADAPCAETGFCKEDICYPPQRICNMFSIIEGQAESGRMSVIIVNEILGF
ncbi:MAG: lactate utilization protein [Candidatus Schekmanbacteria bacterium]|nr:MAG: lactate utilization protein [Candidatus Schekmanbacteria bacterium]